MSSLFQGANHAKAYALYRPVFPAKVFEDLMSYCKKVGNEFGFALDIGCGSGQSTQPLSAHFTQVVGIDPSPAQISHAKAQAGNVQFKVGTSEDLSQFGDGTVDFACAFQALHWFDTKRFYPEIQRVLARRGVLATCGYGNVILDDHAATDVVSQYYWKTLTDGGYWDNRRHHINNHYEEFTFPLDEFHRRETVLEKDMTLEEFLGYMTSWSAYQTYIKKNADDPLVDIRKKLCEAYQCSHPEQQQVKVTWPVFMLLGCKS